jgi:hypothetical protein
MELARFTAVELFYGHGAGTQLTIVHKSGVSVIAISVGNLYETVHSFNAR